MCKSSLLCRGGIVSRPIDIKQNTDDSNMCMEPCNHPSHNLKNVATVVPDLNFPKSQVLLCPFSSALFWVLYYGPGTLFDFILSISPRKRRLRLRDFVTCLKSHSKCWVSDEAGVIAKPEHIPGVNKRNWGALLLACWGR